MTLSAQITADGISAPSYADILASLQVIFQGIYGQDAYIAPDSQDGQLLAAFAAAINDANDMAIAVYNAFSPSTAQGIGLSSVVKINGLKRDVSSNSTAVVTLVGQNGTVITNGIVQDILGNQWSLPASVSIPMSGTIDVTATCTVEGAITAAMDTITRIVTPTRGWQTVNNDVAAQPGAPVESDSTLRQRQSVSTSLPAQTPMDAIVANVANVSGVTRYRGYENDSGTTDGNGIPAHSISLVVGGGDVNDVAAAIALKKTPGTRTYGSTSVVVVDSAGIPNTINFYELSNVPITVEIDVTALFGYVTTTNDLIKSAVAAYINALDIGETVYYLNLLAPANLEGDAAATATGLTQAQLDTISKTFTVTAIRIAKGVTMPSAANVTIAFNEAATCIVGSITVSVT